MKLKITINLLIFLSLLTRIPRIFADVFEECTDIASGTFVAIASDCAAYIYCDGEDSLLGRCDDGQYFDGESCDAKENVYCALDVDAETEESEENAEVEESEYPEEPEETVATTIATTQATISTTISSSVNEIETSSTPFDALTIPPIVKDSCPITDDPEHIILISNSQSCTDYYLCYHGHAIEMHCTDHLHFNAYTGKCDFPENAHCLNDRPNANKCLPHMTDFFPHPENCNYFYYCIKGFMTVQQCPFYYGWDIEKRSCVQISQAKCYSSAKKTLKFKKRYFSQQN